MIRQGRGTSKAKAQVTKLNTSTKFFGGIAVLLLALGLLFTFGAQPANGDGQKQATKANTYQQLKSQRKKTARWMKRADRWAHKRNKHVRHKSLPVTWNLAKEKRRTAHWKRRTQIEKRKTQRWKKAQHKWLKACIRAGFPRSLCPDLIRAAKDEGKLKWATDSNLA